MFWRHVYKAKGVLPSGHWYRNRWDPSIYLSGTRCISKFMKKERKRHTINGTVTSRKVSVQKYSWLYTFNFIFKGIRTIVLNTGVTCREVLLDVILNRIRCVHKGASLLFKRSEVIINTLHLRSEFFLRWLLVVQVTTTWYQCSKESLHCPRLFRACVVPLPELLVLVWMSTTSRLPSRIYFC